jgi:hypothetical protein
MWIEAIVMPRQSAPPSRRGRGAKAAAAPSPAPDRRAVHARGCEEGYQFREAVVGFLRAHHLMDAVRWISEPGALPLVTLHCTVKVVELLRQAPEFEAGVSTHLEFLAAAP